MKRFTESLKWQDPWFRRLSGPSKLLWFYMVDHCDLIGLIELDFGFISYDAGIKISVEHARELGDRVQHIEGGKYFIPKFIGFQYGRLSDSCRPHDKIFEAIKRHSLNLTPEGYRYPVDRVSNTLSIGVSDTPKYKEEEENKEEKEYKKSTVTRARGTHAEVTAYCRERGLFPRDADYLFHMWDENGWKKGGKSIKDWRKVIIAWQAQGYLPSQKNPQAADCWPAEAQPAEPEPDYLELMKMNRAKREAQERADSEEPEGSENGNHSKTDF